jgi:hypothetical protein
MRAKLLAALCAVAFAVGLAAPAEAGGYYHRGLFGWGGCCYSPPVRWVDTTYYPPPRVYYVVPVVERYQVVRFTELNYAPLYAYSGCYARRIPDWRGGWVWSVRAGCF